MASTGRFWKPGHGTMQFSSSSAYDLEGLGSGKAKGKSRGREGKKTASTAGDGGVRIGSSKEAEGLSSRVKGMKFMQRDTKVQADLDAAAALEAGAAAARSSESWSLGLPAGPLVGGASGGLRCVADDHAAPSVAPASAASGKAAIDADADEGVAVAAPGRASYGKFNKSLEALVKERARADKRMRDTDEMDDVGVSDSEMAAALSHSRAKAKGLSSKARRQRIREADNAVAEAASRKKAKKDKRRKGSSRG